MIARRKLFGGALFGTMAAVSGVRPYEARATEDGGIQPSMNFYPAPRTIMGVSIQRCQRNSAGRA